MLRFVAIVFCLSMMVNYSEGQGNQTSFTCYSCTYTLSSDPTYDIECVKRPMDVNKGSPEVACKAPYQCVTKATFNPDKKTVRSLSRSCLPPGAVCEGPRCCNMAGVYPECEHKCRADYCNEGDAQDLSDIMVDPDSGEPGAAVRVTAALSITLPICIAAFTLYL